MDPSDSTTQGQSGPGCNGNERVLHIPQSSRTGDLPSVVQSAGAVEYTDCISAEE